MNNFDPEWISVKIHHDCGHFSVVSLLSTWENDREIQAKIKILNRVACLECREHRTQMCGKCRDLFSPRQLVRQSASYFLCWQCFLYDSQHCRICKRAPHGRWGICYYCIPCLNKMGVDMMVLDTVRADYIFYDKNEVDEQACRVVLDQPTGVWRLCERNRLFVLVEHLYPNEEEAREALIELLEKSSRIVTLEQEHGLHWKEIERFNP